MVKQVACAREEAGRGRGLILQAGRGGTRLDFFHPSSTQNSIVLGATWEPCVQAAVAPGARWPCHTRPTWALLLLPCTVATTCSLVATPLGVTSCCQVEFLPLIFFAWPINWEGLGRNLRMGRKASRLSRKSEQHG